MAFWHLTLSFGDRRLNRLLERVCNITCLSSFLQAIGKSFELAGQNRGNVTLLAFCYLPVSTYFQWVKRRG